MGGPRGTGHCSFAAVRNPDTVGNGNDPRHLRRAYIHRFVFVSDADPNQVSGTTLAHQRGRRARTRKHPHRMNWAQRGARITAVP